MNFPNSGLAPCVLVIEQNAIIGLSLAEDLEVGDPVRVRLEVVTDE